MVAEFAVELARARGEDGAKWFGSRWRTWPWLIWSGPLPDHGDEEAATNALVRKGWWHGKGKVTEIAGEQWVLDILSWLIGHTKAYEVELMPPARATELAEKFISLLPERRRWYGNDWGEDQPELVPPWLREQTAINHPFSQHPCTDRTFDSGLIAVATGRAWIAWFTDED